MSLFGDDRPRITDQEFEQHVRPELRSAGMTDERLDQLQGYFVASLNRPDGQSRQRGIYADELESTMSYLREHPDSTHFDSHELDLIQSTMQKYLESH